MERATIDCPACKQRFSAEMPKITQINTPTFSAMIAPHEQIIRCPNAKCRQPLTFALVGGQVGWTVTTVTEDVAQQVSGSPIIPARAPALI